MTDNEVVSQLVLHELRIGRAIAEGNVAVVEELLAEEFVGTTPEGAVLTKKEVVLTLFSPAYDIDVFENTDIDVRVHGNAAVVVARGVVRGRYHGQDASGQFRYTRVWTRKEGRWLAVAAHSSMLPPTGC
jgi:ketosteroid isomerase-like protein